MTVSCVVLIPGNEKSASIISTQIDCLDASPPRPPTPAHRPRTSIGSLAPKRGSRAHRTPVDADGVRRDDWTGRPLLPGGVR